MHGISKECPVLGKFCSLYRNNGTCAYPGGICRPVVEQCGDCENIINGHCRVYPNPAAVWKKIRGCPRRRNITELERKKFYGTYIAKRNEQNKEQTFERKNEAKKETNAQKKSKKFSETGLLGKVRRFGINLRERLKN